MEPNLMAKLEVGLVVKAARPELLSVEPPDADRNLL